MVRSVAVAAAPSLVLLLAACSSTAPLAVEPLDGSISGNCHADMVRGAVGLAASPPQLERIRVDSDSLQLVTQGSDEDMIGADSGGDRVSVQVGTHNAITAVRCG